MSAMLPFRDINVHASSTYYAFSSPSSPNAPSLVIERPTGDLRLNDGKLTGGHRVSSISGILGIIKLRLGMVCVGSDPPPYDLTDALNRQLCDCDHQVAASGSHKGPSNLQGHIHGVHATAGTPSDRPGRGNVFALSKDADQVRPNVLFLHLRPDQ